VLYVLSPIIIIGISWTKCNDRIRFYGRKKLTHNQLPFQADFDILKRVDKAKYIWLAITGNLSWSSEISQTCNRQRQCHSIF